jgi:hypothetical protein
MNLPLKFIENYLWPSPNNSNPRLQSARQAFLIAVQIKIIWGFFSRKGLLLYSSRMANVMITGDVA